MITPGEPAGIGPDLVLAPRFRTKGVLVVASPSLLAARAETLGLHIEINDPVASGRMVEGALNVHPVELAVPAVAGILNPANARYVIQTLEAAVSLCESGACEAMVTGPVNKAAINDGGIPFTGHTEWLAARTGTAQVVMLLATDGLKVALVTTHLPLREVADAITPDLLERVIRIIHADMIKRFGIAAPRILVLGLNPHAGESGHLGTEEIRIISPVVRDLAAQGFRVTGPLPADTAFTPHILSAHDVVLAMYHDQGLPVLKFKGFGAAANITLGLPIIRTSVDHGTALDIAGTGKADGASLQTAIDYATLMATPTAAPMPVLR